MDHHTRLELNFLAKAYEDQCRQKGLRVPSRPSMAKSDVWQRFYGVSAVAEGLGISTDEYFNLLTKQCVREGRLSPPHAYLAEDWCVDLVKKAKEQKDIQASADIRYVQMMSEASNDDVLIEDIRSFDRLLSQRYKHMSAKSFKPHGWKLIFTKRRRGGRIADTLLDQGVVPDVFKALSRSWAEAYPDDIPTIDRPSDEVIRVFDQLFQDDLVSPVVDRQ